MARGRKLPRTLTDEERVALLAQCNRRYATPHRNLLMMRLMLEAGLRAGEVVALQPAHLTMTSGKLLVKQGKGAKDRVLWVSEDLRDEIGAWLERRPSSKWLFPTNNGTQLDTRYLRTMVKRYAQKAGLSEWEQVSPHTLRHTFATDLYRETKNIRLVQKALGHADLSTTMIYTHIVDDELEAALKGFRRGVGV